MTPRILAGYTAAMAALGVAVVTTPVSWSAYLWGVIALLSVVAIVGGALLHRPRRRSPWWLLAGAALAMGCGDVIFGATVHGPADSAPAIDDVCYFAMFPLLTAGLIDLTRVGSVLRDRSRLIDLSAFTCTAVLAGWAFLVGPTLGTTSLSWEDRSTLVAYNVGDVLIIVVAVRLLVAARRSTALLLLTLGALGALVGDATYTHDQLSGGWTPGGPAEIAYVIFYFAWGAAALHPSMAGLTTPAEPAMGRLRAGWTVLLGLSVAVPPATLLIESVHGGVRDGVLIAATSIVTFTLVITRLADALQGHHAAVARERALRGVCGELVGAAARDQVGDVVRAGVRTLLPDDTDHQVVLRFNEGDEAMDYPLPPQTSHRRTRLVPTGMLAPDLRQRLDGFDHALVCPLIVDQSAARAPGAGGLFVAAPETALATIQDSIEVLAAQAALALDRIGLTEAATRRDSDEYLRAVVQNTTDVVLVVDTDQRVRYASPSLVTVLGIDPPPAATLRDIVHPDDHDQLIQTFTAAEGLTSDESARDVWSLRRPDDSRVLVEVSYRDLRHDPIVRGVVVTMRDVTQEQEQRLDTVRRTLDASPAGQNRRSAARKFT